MPAKHIRKSPPRYDIPASQREEGRPKGWRTVSCDGVLLTAHDVLIIATDGDDDAGAARREVDSSLLE